MSEYKIYMDNEHRHLVCVEKHENFSGRMKEKSNRIVFLPPDFRLVNISTKNETKSYVLIDKKLIGISETSKIVERLNACKYNKEKIGLKYFQAPYLGETDKYVASNMIKDLKNLGLCDDIVCYSDKNILSRDDLNYLFDHNLLTYRVGIQVKK